MQKLEIIYRLKIWIGYYILYILYTFYYLYIL